MSDELAHGVFDGEFIGAMIGRANSLAAER